MVVARRSESDEGQQSLPPVGKGEQFGPVTRCSKDIFKTRNITPTHVATPQRNVFTCPKHDHPSVGWGPPPYHPPIRYMDIQLLHLRGHLDR
jgi:hypothetical protein